MQTAGEPGDEAGVVAAPEVIGPEVVRVLAIAQDVAWAAVGGVRPRYLRAQFLRLKSRRGPKRAVVAVAASILTAAYFILRDGVPYYDLGPTYFDDRDRRSVLRRLTHRIEALGYHVALTPAA